MAWMDGARRIGGLAWVLAGLGFQLVWCLARQVAPGPVTLVLEAAVTLLAVAVVSRRARGVWLVGWLVAVLLGLDLLGAVADRFGAWGPPGAVGVSWGSWSAFVGYTAELLPGPVRDLASVAALGATAAEVLLGVLLLTGWQRRWVGKATAGLFVVYLVAVLGGVGLDAVATYALPTLVGGALLVSACPTRRPAVLPGTPALGSAAAVSGGVR